MKDRIPANPGRVLIKPDDGSAPFYATMTRADNPTQEGTPLNKATLLQDATAALFGLGSDAVPDDVLALIKQMIDSNYSELFSLVNSKAKIATGSYTGTGTYGESNPNNLKFEFEPKLVFMFENEFPVYGDVSATTSYPVYGTTIGMAKAYSKSLFNIYGKDCYLYAKKSKDGKTLSWYHDASANKQMNTSGVKYRYIAIG